MAGDGLTRTRFAPSPTGLLHLGHAFAALTAARLADPGEFLLRIEDIDRDRCRAAFEAAIFQDLRWLGLDWPVPVMRQSERMPAYAQSLAGLDAMGLLYPCGCRRGDIRAALSAPQEGASVMGPDGLVYPGTCRGRRMAEAGPEDAIRLNADRALAVTGALAFMDKGLRHELSTESFISGIGDVILARRGWGTSYHLAVTVDDAAQGITLVTRGADLFEATWIHVLLQQLLELPTPSYWHHILIRDDEGRRLAKRDDARSLRELRDAGATPSKIRQMIGFDNSTSAPSRTAV
ncbi:tRNA glutamyl-Q(34) synthetase GluQRS [Paracoccus sp. S-4012]|uniref:tRNA glutamyl-Q(34) synthetase GluQRS n=1 Tax=Paracoccus sp. S-4012 TaxID=2665648 RepID=UPI0012B10E55|nr:tRNA glutamyl-Q(34) synthetase GluQRS [Paracoccus sp. S-4012]MRX50851.1 tRNA glutamyl-Q(34) synthetase GluQRS [Paracoccus sp. S-4012]